MDAALKAIEAYHLSKTYWFTEKEKGLSGSLRSLLGGRKVFVEAVRRIDLRVEVGEVMGFIGPNGAGKTTTLKMLAGILHPSSGEVRVLGYLPQRREKDFLRRISLVAGQRNRLFWDLPAEEYFEFCRVVYEIPASPYRENLKRLIEMAEIGEIMKVPQRKLSAGQRKRCELAAAFLHDPEVIFLDEPTNALDLINARKVREFIQEKGREGRHTILLTSHNMADIEQVCERITIINRGEIAYDGNLRDLPGRRGLKKQIRILFGGPWEMDELKRYGRILHASGQEVSLEVESQQAAPLTAHLLARFPVKDLSITEMPLERIIESIYLESAGPAPKTDGASDSAAPEGEGTTRGNAEGV